MKKALAKAISQIGYKEGAGNTSKYAKDFDTKWPTFYNFPKNGVDWCDIFFDWCMVDTYGPDLGRKAIYQPLKSAGAGVSWSAGYYKENKAYYTANPQPGDQIFFYNADMVMAHTGMVEKVENGRVYTIEGNTERGAVERLNYPVGWRYIAGYGRPNWALVESSAVPSSAPAAQAPSAPKKTIQQLAAEVWNGNWGVGDDRRRRLEAAGYSYAAVQAEVDKGRPKTAASKSVSQLAQEVLAGQWGNGLDRKHRLERAGYNYGDVQAEVERQLAAKKPLKSNLEVAREVIRGDWGNGAERVKKLTAAGYDAKKVQAVVDTLL